MFPIFTVKLKLFKKYVCVADAVVVLRELRPPNLVLVLQGLKISSPTSAISLVAVQLKKRNEKKVPLNLMLQQQVM